MVLVFSFFQVHALENDLQFVEILNHNKKQNKNGGRIYSKIFYAALVIFDRRNCSFYLKTTPGEKAAMAKEMQAKNISFTQLSNRFWKTKIDSGAANRSWQADLIHEKSCFFCSIKTTFLHKFFR